MGYSWWRPTPDTVPTDAAQHTVMSGGVYDALLTKKTLIIKSLLLMQLLQMTSILQQAVYDALEGLEPVPPGFVQNVDTTMQL